MVDGTDIAPEREGDLYSDEARPEVAAAGSAFEKGIAVSTLALATAACGGGGGSSGAGSPPASGGTGGTPAPTVRKPESDAQAARFILRSALAASPGSSRL